MPINNLASGVVIPPGPVSGLATSPVSGLAAASPLGALSYGNPSTFVWSSNYNNPGSTFTPYELVSNSTNIQSIDTNQLIGMGANLAGSISGIPQVAQIGNSLLSNSDNYNPGFAYTSVPFSRLNKIPGILYQDFRNREGSDKNPSARAASYRLDGLAATERAVFFESGVGATKYKTAVYAAAAASPPGVYSLFNRDANHMFGAGWGDHGNIYALRNDFTVQSHVATKWKRDGADSRWVQTRNPLSLITTFRGDRVQVIDFQRNVKLKNVYKWNKLVGPLGITNDFIKFYFTGPALSPGSKTFAQDTQDGVLIEGDNAIVFRASITSLSDTFQPGWTAISMIGRADSNHHYGSYSRDLSFNFTVYATDRDELKPIWRKLNALAGYTAPKYSETSIALEAPWIRFTIGDLYFQQPAIITSLVYTLQDNDTSWEINIEHDPEMMQVPKKVEVQMGLTLITNELPEQDGKFYTLAKRFNGNQSIAGTDNWLSDFRGNADVEK